MTAKILVIDSSPHIVTGPDNQCECGIDANGKARNCWDILQDMVQRNIGQYLNGKVPPAPVDLGEDIAFVPDASTAEPSASTTPPQAPDVESCPEVPLSPS